MTKTFFCHFCFTFAMVFIRNKLSESLFLLTVLHCVTDDEPGKYIDIIHLYFINYALLLSFSLVPSLIICFYVHKPGYGGFSYLVEPLWWIGMISSKSSIHSC